MNDATDLRDLADSPFSGLVKDAVVLTPDFARRIADDLAARSTPVPASNVSEGLREAAERAEFALSLALGATYEDRSWLNEAMAAANDLRAALAHAAPASEPTVQVAQPIAQPASNVSEGLPTAGFAADRPTGPRTMKGHALASSLRRRLRKGAIDYDAWIRDIEAEAAALAHAAPERLTCLDYAAHDWNSNGSPSFCRQCWVEWPRLEAARRRLSQPDATDEAER